MTSNVPTDWGWTVYDEAEGLGYRTTYMAEYGRDVWAPYVKDAVWTPEPFVTKSQCLAFLAGVKFERMMAELK